MFRSTPSQELCGITAARARVGGCVSRRRALVTRFHASVDAALLVVHVQGGISRTRAVSRLPQSRALSGHSVCAGASRTSHKSYSDPVGSSLPVCQRRRICRRCRTCGRACGARPLGAGRARKGAGPVIGQREGTERRAKSCVLLRANLRRAVVALSARAPQHRVQRFLKAPTRHMLGSTLP